MLLRCVGPRRTERLQRDPRLDELATLRPVGLHARSTHRLASFLVSPR